MANQEFQSIAVEWQDPNGSRVYVQRGTTFDGDVHRYISVGDYVVGDSDDVDAFIETVRAAAKAYENPA